MSPLSTARISTAIVGSELITEIPGEETPGDEFARSAMATRDAVSAEYLGWDEYGVSGMG